MTRLTILLGAVLLAGSSGDSPEVDTEPPPPPAVSFPEDDFDFSAWPAATDQGGMWASWFVAGLCQPPATPEEQRQRDTAVQALEESRKRPRAAQPAAVGSPASPTAWDAFQGSGGPDANRDGCREGEARADALGRAKRCPKRIRRDGQAGSRVRPANGDWEYWYVERQPSLKVTRGRLAYCIDCHQNVKGKDYLFRTYLKLPGGGQ